MSDSPKHNDDSLQSSTLASLTSLSQVSAPRFPSFNDLVHPRTFELSDLVETAPPMRRVGLFEGLLQGHVELLAADAEESPDKYSSEVPALVRALVEKRKDVQSLTDQEHAILDQATIDFATYIPPKPNVEPTMRRAAPRSRAKDDAEDAIPIPGLDTPPEAETPAYWWLR